MADSRPAGADEREREKVRKWLQDWSATTPLLEAERDEQLAALTDDDAWRQCQDLFTRWSIACCSSAHRMASRWGRQFADLKEDPDLLHPFEDALAARR